MDAPLLAVLLRITSRISDLFQRYEALKVQNEVLHGENEQLRTALKECLDQKKMFETQLTTAHIAEMMLGLDEVSPEKRVDIKQKINEFVQKIDKSMELLHKQPIM